MNDLEPTCYETLLGDPTGSLLVHFIDTCEAHRAQLAAVNDGGPAPTEPVCTLDAALRSAVALLREVQSLHRAGKLR
jgi:hypothetical protein